MNLSSGVDEWLQPPWGGVGGSGGGEVEGSGDAECPLPPSSRRAGARGWVCVVRREPREGCAGLRVGLFFKVVRSE